MDNNKQKHFLLIHPWLYSELGHSYIYSKNLEKVAQKNNWFFTALLPKKSLLKDLPSNWLKIIDCPTVKHWHQEVEKKPYVCPRKLIRAKNRFRYYYSLYVFIKNKMKQHSNRSFIFFMEAFGESDVRLLSYLLKLLPTQRISVALIHRYQSKKLGTEVHKYRKHHERITNSGAALNLFTDSELLKEDLEKTLYYPIQVLPIHYIESNLSSPLKYETPIKCWWPGIVRTGKGLQVVKEFAQSSISSNASVELIFNSEAEIERGMLGPHIRKLSPHLNRREYLGWLRKSQVILLPYTDPHYEKASSSIFIETIIANRIPLVYPDTWMAYELGKFNLKELIIDCSPPDLSKKILSVFQNQELQKNMDSMRKNYLHFHQLEHYASLLKESLTF